MKPEQIKELAQEEANKHKFKIVRATSTNEVTGKESTTSEKFPVSIVWVCMPKQQAFLDPTDNDKDEIRTHAFSTGQTIFEFEHKQEEELRKAGRPKKEISE